MISVNTNEPSIRNVKVFRLDSTICLCKVAESTITTLVILKLQVVNRILAGVLIVSGAANSDLYYGAYECFCLASAHLIAMKHPSHPLACRRIVKVDLNANDV